MILAILRVIVITATAVCDEAFNLNHEVRQGLK